MRVVVTGAGGFIGAHVAQALAARGHEVTALVRPGGDPWRLEAVRDAVTVVEVDLRASEAAERVLGNATPEVVCDAAWHGVSNRFYDDPSQLSANLQPHLEWLAAGARVGVRRWIGLGSQAEYGPQSARIDERCVPEPTTLYGAVKLCTGLLSRAIARDAGIELTWLRLFGAYGPMDQPGWLIPSVILTLLRGERPDLTLGTQKWDYLYVQDVAAAIADAVVATSLDGVFNLGSGDAVPVRTIVETVRDLIDPGLPLGFGALPFRPNQVMHLEADASRFAAATGWRPVVPLPVGLERTVEWFRERQRRLG
jgi:nucleoside-diphosphate-sugar epimerase